METFNKSNNGFLTLKLSNYVYDKAKFICLILLPSVATLYFTLGNIWGFSNIEEVVGSIAAFNTFFGIVLGISTKQYAASGSKYDGTIAISSNENGDKLYSLELNGDPNKLDEKTEVVFKIN